MVIRTLLWGEEVWGAWCCGVEQMLLRALRWGISIPVSLLRHSGLPPLAPRLLPLPLAFHPVLLKSSQSADFIECDKWQFIKKWEQMGNGLWKKINDAHRPLNRARFGSKHSLHRSL